MADYSRLARVLAFLLSNMPMPSSQRVMQWPVLLPWHVLTSLCYLKVLGRHRKGSGKDSLYPFYYSLTPFRYVNVDYIVARSMNHNCKPKLIASYNIMCQWAMNLWNRLHEFPVCDSKTLDDRIVARVVLKFHLAVHRPECCANFSLNFEPSAVQKDMEGPERMWFGLQGGGSTKDQGLGFWSDTMDDKFSH